MDTKNSSVTKSNTSVEDLITTVNILINRFNTLEKELNESFKRRDEINKDRDKRLHQRITNIITVQSSSEGCNSVRLLTKDVQSISKDVLRLIGNIEEHRLKIEQIDNTLSKSISPLTFKWGTAILITYSITFGTYIVNSINKLNAATIRTTSILDRNSRDTDRLIKLVYDPKHYK